MIIIEKKLAETPLQALQRLRSEKVEYTSTKLAYAGRLDPMATGKLLVLVGDECKQRDKFQKLDKEYEFEIITGFETDSLDLLGVVTKIEPSYKLDISKLVSLNDHILRLKSLAYPVFSAARVKGKPLYWWYLNGKIDTIDIPSKEITISNFLYIGKRSVSKQDLKIFIDNTLAKIDGDFRKEKILKSYSDLFNNGSFKDFEIHKFKVKVSSGTYIRSIVKEIGKFLEVPVTTFSIHRTEIFLPIS